MRKIICTLFIFLTLLSPLYGAKDQIRFSLSGAAGGGSPYIVGAVGASLDFVRVSELNYRFTLQWEAGDDLSGLGTPDYEGSNAGEYQTVMFYGGISDNAFYKYGGYQLSLNFGAGGVKRRYDGGKEVMKLNVGLYGEARGYLGPLFAFLRVGGSAMGGNVMIGIGISSF